jgi:hypothetical protein
MRVIRHLFVLLVFVAPAAAQGGALRGPATAVAGGTITVQVASNDATVAMVDASTGSRIHVDVQPGKTATLPVPNVPPGTFLIVSVGRGLRASFLFVEVVSP